MLFAAQGMPYFAGDTHQSDLFTIDIRQDFGRTAESGAFIIDLREADSKLAISNIFVLDLRNSGTPAGNSSNLFTVDLRAPQDQPVFFDDFEYPSVDGQGGLLLWTGSGEEPVWTASNKQNLAIDGSYLLLKHTSTDGFGLSPCGTVLKTSRCFGPGTYAALVKFDGGTAREKHHTQVQSFGAASQSPDATTYYSRLDMEYLPWDGWEEEPDDGHLGALWASSWERENEAYKKGESFKTNLEGDRWYGLLLNVSPGKSSFKLYSCEGEACEWEEINTGYSKDGTSYPADSDLSIVLANWLSTCTLDESGQRVCPPQPPGCATGYDEYGTALSVDWVFYQKDMHLTFQLVAEIVDSNLRALKRIQSPEASTPFLPPTNPTAAVKGSSTVDVSWDHTGGASGFSLAWRTERGHWIDAATNFTGNSASVTDLMAGIKYAFKVRAIDQRGWASQFSQEVYATIPGTPMTSALVSWLPPPGGGMNPPVDLKVSMNRGKGVLAESSENRETTVTSACKAPGKNRYEVDSLTGYEIFRAASDSDPDYASITALPLPPERLYYFDNAMPETDVLYYRAKALYDGGESGWSKTVSIQKGIPGDCDGEGTVSIGEVQKAINMFLGIQAPSCGADCDGNSQVSIGEVQKVLNAFLGLPASC